MSDSKDLEFALAVNQLLRRHGTAPPRNSEASADEEWRSWPRYDADLLSGFSIWSLYVGHRLLDHAKTGFDIQDASFLENYRDWHRELHRHVP